MNRCVLVLGLFLLFSSSASSVTVVLTADKTEVYVNEIIRFHLEVRDAGHAGGGFTIYREVEEKTFAIVKGPMYTSACTLCRGVSDVGDLNEEPSFIPLVAGSYRATATYGGVTEDVDFTVHPLTTTSTTSMTTSSTRQVTTSSTSSTPSSSSTSSTTSSTPGEPSTTLMEVVDKKEDKTDVPYLPFIVLLFFLAALSYLYLGKRC